jgi:hypothetical protein
MKPLVAAVFRRGRGTVGGKPTYLLTVRKRVWGFTTGSGTRSVPEKLRKEFTSTTRTMDLTDHCDIPSIEIRTTCQQGLSGSPLVHDYTVGGILIGSGGGVSHCVSPETILDWLEEK